MFFALASCSDKFTLMKRKYNKGFYVSIKGKSANKNVASNSAITKPMAKCNEFVSTEVAKTEPASPATAVLRVNDQKPSAKRAAIKKEIQLLASASRLNKESHVFPVKKVSQFKALSLAPNKKDASDADVKLVLLVILAIFVPPLAIYLKDNKAVSNWFWITLILCLVSLLGFYLFVYGSLLWLVAVIIALLRVFNAL